MHEQEQRLFIHSFFCSEIIRRREENGGQWFIKLNGNTTFNTQNLDDIKINLSVGDFFKLMKQDKIKHTIYWSILSIY